MILFVYRELTVRWLGKVTHGGVAILLIIMISASSPELETQLR